MISIKKFIENDPLRKKIIYLTYYLIRACHNHQNVTRFPSYKLIHSIFRIRILINGDIKYYLNVNGSFITYKQIKR